MQTEPVYLYAPSTDDGLITGRETIGIVARPNGGMKIDPGSAATVFPTAIPGISLAAEEAWGLLEMRLVAAANRGRQIRAALEREDVRRLVSSAQTLRAALYRAESLDPWPSLRSLRGGQPGLVKGQNALEICIPPAPGLIRVAYRTEPIEIDATLCDLARLLSVLEGADELAVG